jgi:hypothetical protein
VCGYGTYSDNPFTDAEEGDVRPWHRYRRSPCGIYKMARDKICGVCASVFNTSELRLQFKTFTKLIDAISKTPDLGARVRKMTALHIEAINTADGESSQVLLSMKAQNLVERVHEECPPPPRTVLHHRQGSQGCFPGWCGSIGLSYCLGWECPHP